MFVCLNKVGNFAAKAGPCRNVIVQSGDVEDKDIHIAMYYNVLQCIAMYCNVLWRTKAYIARPSFHFQLSPLRLISVGSEILAIRMCENFSYTK